MAAFVITSKTHTASKMDQTNSASGSSSSMGKFWVLHSEECSLVDSSWELVDPCPDVHALFIQFNDRFFWGSLSGCEVRWSPRMTLCAGQCHYEGRGGLCSVRLSTPLLKLRPRKDLVETLLHEMIHAYLFVTERNTDHDGHGPNFQMHMKRINAEAGTNITIYHSFHAEVALYKQHWWRCNGPCRNRKPYYGWVKRATNRAPSKNDFWWSDHEKNCGGKYEKVKEPEGYLEKKNKKAHSGAKSVGNVTGDKPGTSKQSPTKKKSPVKIDAPDPKQAKIDTFFGRGQTLGGSSSTSRLIGQNEQKNQKVPPENPSTQSHRNVPKLPDAKPLSSKSEPRLILAGFVKKNTAEDNESVKPSHSDRTTFAEVIDLSSVQGSPQSEMVPCPSCTAVVSSSLINSHLDLCLS